MFEVDFLICSIREWLKPVRLSIQPVMLIHIALNSQRKGEEGKIEFIMTQLSGAIEGVIAESLPNA